MTKAEIASVLEEIGVLLELKGENPFKIRAYGAGARALEALEEAEMRSLIADGKLETIKGIGEALAQKITELHATGGLGFYDKLKASIPAGMVELLDVPGLGAKKIRALHDKLGVDSVASLKSACEAGRVAELAGFGAKTQQKLLEGIKNREAYAKRHLWWDAREVSQVILAGLRTLPQVEQAEAAGSLRRGLETVGDLDFIVAATDWEPIVTWFTGMEGVGEVTARGETKASVRLASGLQADLRIVPATQFAFALHHFTGSKDHNVSMRQRALARGWSLSEWGLAPAEGEGTVKAKVAEAGVPSGITDETALFRALGLAFIPPELREGRCELVRAETGVIENLIQVSDLRGAFHNHTTASDGSATLREMAAAAGALGWEYLGIADHSKSSFQARGLDEARLAAQVDEIRRLNDSGESPVWLFAGSECDILPDGRLDFSEETLATLDYVVASVHNAFTQSEEEMTARLIRAIEHPAVTMIGHLTGRLLLRRPGYAVNIEKILDAAAANGVILELNANPWRLDLDWRHWARAAGKGVLGSINPDAHDTAGLAHVEAGVIAARKAGLTASHFLNTRPLAEVRKYLQGKRR